jgi:hypothetical protein
VCQSISFDAAETSFSQQRIREGLELPPSFRQGRGAAEGGAGCHEAWCAHEISIELHSLFDYTCCPRYKGLILRSEKVCARERSSRQVARAISSRREQARRYSPSQDRPQQVVGPRIDGPTQRRRARSTVSFVQLVAQVEETPVCTFGRHRLSCIPRYLLPASAGKIELFLNHLLQ